MTEVPDTLSTFIEGTDERCMWVDPLANDSRAQGGAVLLDDVISDYVAHFNILIDKATFGDGKLKGGSYTMTPDENQAWTFVPDRGATRKVPLTKGRDNVGEYYVVPHNSLVYIKLKQTIRLPFYIIGRHNLKIRYVYKGLLLGTGPQVDPGFVGNLFIPLHNFTTSPVHIYFTGEESSFVSIDFVRTTPFLPKADIPKNIYTVDEFRQHLQHLGSPRTLIEKKKVKKRKELEDYLEGDMPRSQLAHFQLHYEEFEKSIREELDRAKRLTTYERMILFITVGSLLIGTIGVLIATTNFFRGYVTDIKAETKEVKTAVAAAGSNGLGSRVASLESSFIEFTNQSRVFFTVTNANATMESRLGDLQDRLMRVETQLLKYHNDSTNAGATNPSAGLNR
jgi:deoxycytidine triphosphate deaminase